MIKEDCLYTKSHEWVKVDGDIATIGITDHAQHELGDIVFVELPAVGDDVIAGESFGSIEAVKAVEDINSPVSGEVVEANEALEDAPETINNSAFEEGWIIKVKLSNVAELDKLIKANAYKELIG